MTDFRKNNSSRYPNYNEPYDPPYRLPRARVDEEIIDAYQPSSIDYESDIPPQRPHRHKKPQSVEYRASPYRHGFLDLDREGSGYLSNDDRTISEYTLQVEKLPVISRAPSELSYITDRTAKTFHSVVPPSEYSTKTKTSRYGRIEVETMTAPHPYCPNTRGCCCLMILLNLGLLLVTLGFIVVLQLRRPIGVWYFGICMLIFGFLTMLGSLVYCVYVCRENPQADDNTSQLYWTRHWKRSLEAGSDYGGSHITTSRR